MILAFTIMMALHLIGSANIVKRFGAKTANTVMFGSSTVLLLLGVLGWSPLPTDAVSIPIVSSVLYIGVATASVFLLRYRVLQTISPVIVAVDQNLTPVCALLFAHAYLGEPIQVTTLVGGGILLLGAELVRRAHLATWAATIPAGKWPWGASVGHKLST